MHGSPPSADRVSEGGGDREAPSLERQASQRPTDSAWTGGLQGMWPRAGFGEEPGKSPFRAVSPELKSPGSVCSPLHIKVLVPRSACPWAWRV